MKALVRMTPLATFIVVLATVTFAASKNQGNFTLQDTARVGSTELRPGQYKVEWTAGTDGAAKVEILQRGKTVATAEGRLKDLEAPSPYDAVIIKPVSDNQKSIAEIDFSKQKQALVFEGE
jgi:hypothetical protein